MRRLLPILALAAGLAVVVTAVSAAFAPASTSGTVPLSHWLEGAKTQALDKVFGGATPTRTFSISYPRTIAVVFEFRRVVICRTCSGSSNATIPRGRVIRVSFNRRTHRLAGSMQFCEIRGSLPARALCLRR